MSWQDELQTREASRRRTDRNILVGAVTLGLIGAGMSLISLITRPPKHSPTNERGTYGK
jgi:hypothetical protein